jgi:hypothetical protein
VRPILDHRDVRKCRTNPESRLASHSMHRLLSTSSPSPLSRP